MHQKNIKQTRQTVIHTRVCHQNLTLYKKIHQNSTTFWVVLLTCRQTDRQTDEGIPRFSNSLHICLCYFAFVVQNSIVWTVDSPLSSIECGTDFACSELDFAGAEYRRTYSRLHAGVSAFV